MTVALLILTGWGAILGSAFALFRAADKPLPSPLERSPVDALNRMGAEAERVEWTPGGGWRLR